jgi:hypothetical protein
LQQVFAALQRILAIAMFSELWITQQIAQHEDRVFVAGRAAGEDRLNS